MDRALCLVSIVALLPALAVTAEGAEMTLCADIPSQLGPATWQPNQVFKSDGAGGYFPVVTLSELGNNVGIDAVQVISSGATSGVLLMSPDATFIAGGVDYEPKDIAQVTYDTVADTRTYCLYQGGGTASSTCGAPAVPGLGLARNANIDAIAKDGSGNLLISFDAPVTVGTTIFQAGDVAKVISGVIQTTPAFVAASVGLGSAANTIEIEEDGGDFYLLFDTPVTSGSQTFQPGAIAKYKSGATSLTPYWSDPSMVKESALTGLAFKVKPSAAPGAVPDGKIITGTPLTVLKGSGTTLNLAWGASCIAPLNYSVYEGAIGNWTGYVPAQLGAGGPACSTAGVPSANIAPGAGNKYYIIVPNNYSGASCTVEGSYGFRSDGQWRPQSASPCCSSQMVRTCP